MIKETRAPVSPARNGTTVGGLTGLFALLASLGSLWLQSRKGLDPETAAVISGTVAGAMATGAGAVGSVARDEVHAGRGGIIAKLLAYLP